MASASRYHSTSRAISSGSADEGVTHPELVASACQLLQDEEQYRARPYMCSERYPTVGFGQRIGPRDAPLTVYRFTLPRPVAETWLRINVALLCGQLATHPGIAPAFANANLTRQTILVSMAYQLGVAGLAGFKNALSAGARGDWREAARHALDSQWAKQTPERAKRHAMALERGELIGALTLKANAGEQR